MTTPIAILQRLSTSDQGTLGELTDARGLHLATLELPWRDNARRLSCIPAGRYDVIWHKSPRFGWVYKLLGTEPREEILMHPGNYAGDKSLGYRTDSQGCILPGLDVGKLIGPLGPQLAVMASRAAVDRLAEHFGRASFTLEIRDP